MRDFAASPQMPEPEGVVAVHENPRVFMPTHQMASPLKRDKLFLKELSSISVSPQR
jgi:hypothetical protein